MTATHEKIIAQELGLAAWQVENTLGLFEKNSTIPFISRYRKEATGSLDEIMIEQIKKEKDSLVEIDKRRETITEAISKQDKLTPELKKMLEQATSLTELEDIYLPYKIKKKTRAVKAREAGLEPLAKILMKQKEVDPGSRAVQFINESIKNEEEALQGARDIIAEWVSEDQRVRNNIRGLFKKEAVIESTVIKGKEEEAVKYKDYFDFRESLKKCPSHRLLALRRGEKEGFLRAKITVDGETAIHSIEKFFVHSNNICADQISMAIEDSYKRLIYPSIETEFSNLSKDKADDEAILVFQDNLRQLLLAPPLGAKRILAIDPGYRTGCKIVCLDEQGNLMHNETIYPHKPQEETKHAAKKISTLVQMYNIEAIAVGNGTASRETEYFIRKRIRFDRDIKIYMVDESGASVYSASSIARKEFPQYDVTVRGAVSIGRRLMDSLAELVKIDPKSIGVGQYQHDVNQAKLKESLDRTVESCVNMVGVDLNTASSYLLAYVSGLGPQLADNIIEYRREHGAFKSRKELMKVKRMGAKSFEQSAGFLRIRNADNPLDNSAVHPESYHIIERMADDLHVAVSDIIGNNEVIRKIQIGRYVTDGTGLPTLNDIIRELEKPGRDPRKDVRVFEFSNDIYKIDDLQVGMVLPGIVTNVTNFGAFVDIGIKENGLVHISNLAQKFVSNPHDVVKLHQHVKVKVTEVDISRKRIQLSMKDV